MSGEIPFLNNEVGGRQNTKFYLELKKPCMSSKPFTFAPAGHRTEGKLLGCWFPLPSWLQLNTKLEKIPVTYSIPTTLRLGDNIPSISPSVQVK